MSVATPRLALPYPGLRPFEAEDHPLFFGREAQVNAMLRQLEDHRFVAVVGSSGSGKSSLVRAGLLPALREGFLLGTTDWLTIVIKPGHQPYQRLVRALHRATRRDEDPSAILAEDGPLTPEETATLATLRRTDRGLLNALDPFAISPGSRIMVVVDQFEELFAFRRAGVNRDNVASRDEAAAFVGMLLRSASEPAGRVWAILTMRSDFIGDCEAFLGLPEQISRSQFLVPRLDRGQMEEAITRPAAVEEAAFKTFTFEEGLVNRIINDAGDRPDQLPLMQHALMRTWKRAIGRAGGSDPMTVSLEDYETAGGIDRALSLHADAAWDEIKADPKKADLGRRLFLLLCDISPDGQITRRRPQVAEVQTVTAASVVEIEQVLRVFQQDDRNFLLPPPPQPLTAESYLDISHEALLRQWRRFADEWQDLERRDASELCRLAELASFRKQGEGGLIPALDLERIARWKKRVSAEWARRYVTEDAWEETVRFVAESQLQAEQQREKEQSEDERKRKDELRQKQARLIWVCVSVVGIFLLVATGFSVRKMKEAEAQQKIALDALELAKVEKLRAEKATTLAKDEAAKAKQATLAAQEALNIGFVRTIGVSQDSELPTADERDALWELAKLDPVSAPVREQVIDYWFQTPESVPRALKRQGQGLHAAVGLNERRQKDATANANKLAEQALGRISFMTPVDEVFKSGTALAALASWMKPGDAAKMAAISAQKMHGMLLEAYGNIDEQSLLSPSIAGLAAWMDKGDATDTVERMARSLENPKSSSDLTSLANALTALALASQVDTNKAASIADRLAMALEISDYNRSPQAVSLATPQKYDAKRLSNLGDVLVALASAMELPDAARLADRLTKALEKPEETDTARLSSLGKALVASAARGMTLGAAAESVAQALEKATSIPRRTSLATTLAALAARMDPAEASRVTAPAAQVLADQVAKADARNLLGMDIALIALAARLQSKDAQIVAEPLATALEKSPTDKRLPLAAALAAAAVRMEKDGARFAESLTKALEESKETDPPDFFRRADLGVALAALAGKMEDKTAATVVAARGAEVFVKALEKQSPEETDQGGKKSGRQANPDDQSPQETDQDGKKSGRQANPDELQRLADALAAFATRIDPKDIPSLTAPLARLMEKTKETDASRLSSLGTALAALASRMEPRDTVVAARAALALVTALKNPQAMDSANLSNLGWTLGELSQLLPPARSTQLAALSNGLLKPVSGPPKQGEPEAKDRRLVGALYAALSAQELTEVLKWPFCVGEAQKLALAKLETKIPGKFDGDLWKFVDQAPSLGIKDLDQPAKQPVIEDAIKELKELVAGSEVKSSVPDPNNPDSSGSVENPARVWLELSTQAAEKNPDGTWKEMDQNRWKQLNLRLPELMAAAREDGIAMTDKFVLKRWIVQPTAQNQAAVGVPLRTFVLEPGFATADDPNATKLLKVAKRIGFGNMPSIAGVEKDGTYWKRIHEFLPPSEFPGGNVWLEFGTTDTKPGPDGKWIKQDSEIWKKLNERFQEFRKAAEADGIAGTEKMKLGRWVIKILDPKHPKPQQTMILEPGYETDSDPNLVKLRKLASKLNFGTTPSAGGWNPKWEFIEKLE